MLFVKSDHRPALLCSFKERNCLELLEEFQTIVHFNAAQFPAHASKNFYDFFIIYIFSSI